jgi:hypothetical protein
MLLAPSEFMCVRWAVGWIIWAGTDPKGRGRKLRPVGAIGSKTLKMEAACPSEMSVSVYKTARCHNPEDLSLNNKMALPI